MLWPNLVCPTSHLAVMHTHSCCSLVHPAPPPDMSAGASALPSLAYPQSWLLGSPAVVPTVPSPVLLLVLNFVPVRGHHGPARCISHPVLEPSRGCYKLYHSDSLVHQQLWQPSLACSVSRLACPQIQLPCPPVEAVAQEGSYQSSLTRHAPIPGSCTCWQLL